MLSEKGLEDSFLPVLPDYHLGSIPKCELLPATGSRRNRHHPDRARCRWQMAPRHPATRVFDRRAAHRSHGAPIRRQITAIQPLLWFVPNRRRVHSSPLNGRTHPENELRGP